jgi:hypothetical protein
MLIVDLDPRLIHSSWEMEALPTEAVLLPIGGRNRS